MELAYRFLSNTIRQYAATKKDIAGKFLAWEKSGVRRIVFYGVSDEMEIAYASMQGANLELVGIVDDDPAKQNGRFFDLLIASPQELFRWRPDGVLITSVKAREGIRNELENNFSGLGFQVELL